MKPSMLISPAQAEVLLDTFAGLAPEEDAPQDPWLDEDALDDFLWFPTEENRLMALTARTRQAA